MTWRKKRKGLQRRGRPEEMNVCQDDNLGVMHGGLLAGSSGGGAVPFIFRRSRGKDAKYGLEGRRERSPYGVHRESKSSESGFASFQDVPRLVKVFFGMEAKMLQRRSSGLVVSVHWRGAKEGLVGENG